MRRSKPNKTKHAKCVVRSIELAWQASAAGIGGIRVKAPCFSFVYQTSLLPFPIQEEKTLNKGLFMLFWIPTMSKKKIFQY
jgi:hypothetical protein